MIEEFKVIVPDKKLIELTKMIINQNDEILKQNHLIIRALCIPAYLLNCDRKSIDEKKG